jgi:uncharacterized protein (DUF169 family)
MGQSEWQEMGRELKALLGLGNPPLAITFSHAAPAGVERVAGEPPEPAADGRTGKVPAGCVFWIKAAERTFSTRPEDHANCSVGSMTHGLKTMDEVAGNGDVAAILEAGWATLEMVPRIPVVKERHEYVTYGPLTETLIDPDVVFLRLNPKQLMVLHDAIPEMRMEGKPQCHIVAIAKEDAAVAASVGCMLSRARTGMPASEMTCAIPAKRLREVLERLRETAKADSAVAGYAAEDARRFPDEYRA